MLSGWNPSLRAPPPLRRSLRLGTRVGAFGGAKSSGNPRLRVLPAAWGSMRSVWGRLSTTGIRRQVMGLLLGGRSKTWKKKGMCPSPEDECYALLLPFPRVRGSQHEDVVWMLVGSEFSVQKPVRLISPFGNFIFLSLGFKDVSCERVIYRLIFIHEPESFPNSCSQHFYESYILMQYFS
jgi:hypothetical protein